MSDKTRDLTMVQIEAWKFDELSDAYLREQKKALDMMKMNEDRRLEKGEWHWTGDPEADSLQSLASDCIVCIRAGDLRNLVGMDRVPVEPDEHRLRDELDRVQGECERLRETLSSERSKARADVAAISMERDAAILSESEAAKAYDSPDTSNFLSAVRAEAAHQIHRFGADHDGGKSAPDWFWLLGFLAGKALSSSLSGDQQKALHHTISSAAVLMNWHAYISGSRTRFRPGIGTDLDPET